MGDDRITVAVLGGSGFIGAELMRLLAAHPQVEPKFVSSARHAGQRVGQVVPGLRNSPVGEHRMRGLDEMSKVDVAVACLPNGTLPTVLEEVSANADLVVNVAGDYRLRQPDEIAKHYPESAGGWRHPIPYWVPEFCAKPTEPVLNLPGCMAASTLYAIYPLFQAGVAAPQVVVDAKTGSSGSGSGSVEHPAIRDGNVRVHRLHGHRHAPEVRQAITDLTGNTPDIQFSTFSLPVARGVMVSAYGRLNPGAGIGDVRRAFARAYADTPFVRMANGRTPMALPMLKTVVGSNVAEVGVAVEDDRWVSVCTLDNLIKGGAGQAVQALNRVYGLDERLGLPEAGGWP
ncbi:N-acetyl-gamma-glutamyl-phosphate reductase [Micromonospora sp. WMMD1102]|uniref:N-acetyl-gamma-glutamyl-phosphate reductase n=1 Tax=Micromonospora sp. WMMD1102 TaxID=3016105 RepID=UPI00241579EC|nr:N-acetyl-gamma-glutamyl-phosphate reductase [Micromonospora sp. WMMD1102]MDG4785117.1 N-acetyl-gamma-glutamyl-phosphate reductase [Micromonospora sp. WMMD1102]